MEKEIIEKVLELYQKYGIKSITMDDVARELGISKKTLYQHVKDKADLVSKVVFNTLNCIMGLVNEVQDRGLNAINELLEINIAVSQAIARHNQPSMRYDLRKYYPDIFNEFNQAKRDSTLRSIIRNLEKGKMEGLYRADMNSEIVAKIHVARMEYQLDDEFFQMEKFSQEEIFKEVFNYHLHGICSAKGIQVYEKMLEKNPGFINYKS